MSGLFLQKLPIFHEIPLNTLNRIASCIQTVSYKKGEILFTEHDEAQGVCFIKSGIVRLTKGDSSGRELIVCIKKTGDIFAEACLFAEVGTTYPATAQMQTDGDILLLKTADLEDEMMKHPELGVVMVRYMSRQLRTFTDTLRDVALLDVHRKTISTLDRLANEFGTKIQSGVQIELPLTVQDFANMIGATRESVSRVFSRLKREKIIDVKEKKIIINNWCEFCTLYKLQHFA
ncbi:Crp/Fnr family transcriptional regulator [Bacillus sp. HMF5848]|uniref:Crp/Fnr family transcriptional regulator n=1 Tax=Bacillus sp. HMF5848 TaxID=2495421 RepID=UPI000F7A304C|nr:Crp/Fnr family transcriptional regulator [Bacillus sp. HMF5848]RSK27930.1 Crp/Fnr family transcriptional regulator [Bacillus sp. HMF5848]